jgi:hypothetical protein
MVLRIPPIRSSWLLVKTQKLGPSSKLLTRQVWGIPNAGPGNTNTTDTGVHFVNHCLRESSLWGLNHGKTRMLTYATSCFYPVHLLPDFSRLDGSFPTKVKHFSFFYFYGISLRPMSIAIHLSWFRDRQVDGPGYTWTSLALLLWYFSLKCSLSLWPLTCGFYSDALTLSPIPDGFEK